MPKLKERKPLPEVHEFSENIKGTHVGPSGSGSSKGMQLDLFSSVGIGSDGDIHSAVNHRGGKTKSTVTDPNESIYCNICANTLPAGFCHICFQTFAPNQMSSDPRYCQRCKPLLDDEATLIPIARSKPHWVPRNGSVLPRKKHHHSCNHKPAHTNGVSKELPIRKIKTMAAKGMKSNRIAAELIKQGYTVNYRTIAKKISNGGGSNGNKTKSRAKPERLPIAGTKKPRIVSARS